MAEKRYCLSASRRLRSLLILVIAMTLTCLPAARVVRAQDVPPAPAESEPAPSPTAPAATPEITPTETPSAVATAATEAPPTATVEATATPTGTSAPRSAAEPTAYRLEGRIDGDDSLIIRVSPDQSEALVARVPQENLWLPMFDRFITVSPDGRCGTYVTADSLFMQNTHLWLVDLESLAVTELAWFSADFWTAPLVWSPDSASIAFTRTTPERTIELWALDVHTGAQTLLTADGAFRAALFQSSEAVISWPETGLIRFTDTVSETDFMPIYTVDLASGAVTSERTVNTAAVTARVGGVNELPCAMVLYAQNDPQWSGNVMQTCNETIGYMGCALTSTAMLFHYYGVDTTPAQLNTCLGSSACPIYWGTTASNCSSSKVSFDAYLGFSWDSLAADLQLGKPVILGMASGSNTHWVVVIAGSGSAAAGYTINDPWSGQQRSLSYYGDWTYTGLRKWSGTPRCLSGPCYTLTTSVTGSGTISASPLPNCGASQYTSGTSVQLTANPASGWSFSAWSGDASGSTSPTTVTMSAARSVTAAFTSIYANTEFGYGSGWSDPQTPRVMADVNADGYADIVGFSPAGVRVALGNGTTFAASTLWLAEFGSDAAAGGWDGAQTIRTLADVNGDGRADIVGFGSYGVLVSLSTGASFSPASYWIYGFGSAPAGGGWNTSDNNRVVADVNGDGRADIVGYGLYGVQVALSTGTSFSPATYWVMGYGRDLGGWDGIQNPRMVADVNGDGCGDVVGFANYGVLVSLSNACGSGSTKTFGSPAYWAYGYAYQLGGWDSTHHIRTFGDVNNDGYDDLVGFGDYGVLVSTSNGSSLAAAASYWKMGYGYVNGGWQVDRHPRAAADVNNDGRADVVGFATDGVLVSRCNGGQFE